MIGLGVLETDEFRRLVRLEAVQMHEEGFEIEEFTDDLKRLNCMSLKELEGLYIRLKKAKPKRDYPYNEPTNLNDIRALRPSGPRALDVSYSKEELESRLTGAWFGRCVGCLFGKPFEGLSRRLIEQYLKEAGEHPPRGYLPPLEKPPKGFPRDFIADRREVLRGGISCMPRDDDIDYTIINLHLAETYGFRFKTEDVGFEWLTHLPYGATYTAERAAYRNLVLGLKPPETATHLNPYREWIGAQIRADMWGYVSPGKIETAAEMAYRDSVLSHVKNGVYGEMFIAATLAAALAVEEVEEALSIGLTEIPFSSRFSEVVRKVMQWSRRDGCWTETWEKVMKLYGRYHRVHVLNNAAIVVLSLTHGEQDFMKSLSIALMSGLDTDCNCATVGSILGALKGFKSIPEEMVKPLNDRIRSLVAGFDSSSIKTLANRTVELAMKHGNLQL